MLIIGLGNPGKKYTNTRHNVGYAIIDELALRQAQGEKNLDGFILAKTETFMNLSGPAVKKIISQVKIKISDLVAVHDDIDLPLGKFKMQKGRSSAGHKGVQSIIDALKTKDFWRIRIGIYPKTGKPENVEKFVLQRFAKEEQKILKEVIEEITLRLAELAQGKQKS